MSSKFSSPFMAKSPLNAPCPPGTKINTSTGKCDVVDKEVYMAYVSTRKREKSQKSQIPKKQK